MPFASDSDLLFGSLEPDGRCFISGFQPARAIGFCSSSCADAACSESSLAVVRLQQDIAGHDDPMLLTVSTDGHRVGRGPAADVRAAPPLRRGCARRGLRSGYPRRPQPPHRDFDDHHTASSSSPSSSSSSPRQRRPRDLVGTSGNGWLREILALSGRRYANAKCSRNETPRASWSWKSTRRLRSPLMPQHHHHHHHHQQQQ